MHKSNFSMLLYFLLDYIINYYLFTEKQTLEDHNGWEESSTRNIGKLQDKVRRKEEELRTTKG